MSARINLKLNYQPGPNDSFMGMLQYDNYNIIGRCGVPAALCTDELTNREDAPEWVFALQWRHLFGSKTFSEVKYNGWTGFYDLNPEVNKPGIFDGSTGLYSQSQGWFYYADRGRNQVNASLSHYAEGFGKHDLKFGVEIERSKVRSRYGYLGARLLRLHRLLPQQAVPGLHLLLRHRGEEPARVGLRPGLLARQRPPDHQRRRALRLGARATRPTRAPRARSATARSTTRRTGPRAWASPTT